MSVSPAAARRVRSAGLWVALALLVTAVTIPSPAQAATTPRAPLDPTRQVSRVLVISVPGVGWEDLDRQRAPNLERLLARSAVANSTVRSGGGGLAAPYLTLGAGKKSKGTDTASDGLGFDVDDRFGAATAGEAFERRTGRASGNGLVLLGIDGIQDVNDGEPGGSSVGALGTALRAHGHRTAVIGNANGSVPDDALPRFRRYAVGGLVSAAGRVDGGRVDDGLLLRDGEAPFGVRLDNDAVLTAFDDVWTDDAVVLVEASDMNRAMASRPFGTTAQDARSYAAALERSDALVGALLERVDFARDAVVVVSPGVSPTSRGLTVVGVRAPGVEPGVMKSASTRRKGYVLLADVAPSVLQILDIARPKSMNGRPFTVSPARGTASQRSARLVSAAQAARFRDRVLDPVTYTTAAVAAAVVLAAVLAWETRRRRAWRGVARFGASWLLGFVPAVFVARLFAFHRSDVVAYYLFVVGLAVALALLYELAGARDPVLPTVLGLGGVVGILVLDLLTGARLQLSTAYGYTPSIGIRFAGVGNVAYAFLSASAVFLAGLLAHRIGGRRGVWIAIALMAGALVVDAAPMFGGDVGGAVSMTPAFAVVALLLLGRRIRARTAVVVLVAGVVAVALMGAIDLARPARDRTHLGRLLANVQDRGIGELVDVLHRKLDSNLRTWTGSSWRAMLVIGVLFVAYLVWRARPRLRALLTRVPELRASLAGFGVLVLLGYALNDSGVAVPAVMSVVLISVLVGLMMRGLDQPIEDEPGRATPASTDSVLVATPSH